VSGGVVGRSCGCFCVVGGESLLWCFCVCVGVCVCVCVCVYTERTRPRPISAPPTTHSHTPHPPPPCISPNQKRAKTNQMENTTNKKNIKNQNNRCTKESGAEETDTVIFDTNYKNFVTLMDCRNVVCFKKYICTFSTFASSKTKKRVFLVKAVTRERERESARERFSFFRCFFEIIMNLREKKQQR